MLYLVIEDHVKDHKRVLKIFSRLCWIPRYYSIDQVLRFQLFRVKPMMT